MYYLYIALKDMVELYENYKAAPTCAKRVIEPYETHIER